MAEFSRFWTTNNQGDGPSAGYSAANFQQFVRETFLTNWAAEGVLFGILNNLAVSGTSSPVAVASGAALVYGFYYGNDASVSVTIPTPASATRIDRIVLRVSWAAQTVRITRIAGTEGAGGAPAMTQTANTTWDIPLANVSITTGGVCTVTDQRTYVKHPGVYGWLQQANTFNGNQTVVGTLAATQHQVDSSNYWTLSGGVNPVMVWDGVNDYTLFNRAGNTLSDVIGGVIVRSLNASGDMSIPGSFSAGGINASQLTSGTVPLARLSGIGTSQLAADSVDNTIVGNLVPAMLGRQGGNASNWATAGSSNYTPGAIRFQVGSAVVTSSSSPTTITFPVAFSNTPVVLLTSLIDGVFVTLTNPTASNFGAYARLYNGSYPGGLCHWLAIGPE